MSLASAEKHLRSAVSNKLIVGGCAFFVHFRAQERRLGIGLFQSRRLLLPDSHDAMKAELCHVSGVAVYAPLVVRGYLNS